jgi:hypothetical protein
LSRHRPYVYYLWQFDHTDPWPDDPYQAFQYDSRYLGVGSTGSILLANLRYTTELAWESGRSFAEGQKHHREEIHALALDVLLEYLFEVPRHPKVVFEYLWGSGDASRRASSTSTIGGNLAGTRDEAFNAFGFRDTGLAFAPRIANLHIFQIAASGAISDINARRDSDWVGWEWDVYLNWRLASDLALTLRYGVFDPGAAFLDKERRHFLYTGVTYSF